MKRKINKCLTNTQTMCSQIYTSDHSTSTNVERDDTNTESAASHMLPEDAKSKDDVTTIVVGVEAFEEVRACDCSVFVRFLTSSLWQRVLQNVYFWLLIALYTYVLSCYTLVLGHLSSYTKCSCFALGCWLHCRGFKVITHLSGSKNVHGKNTSWGLPNASYPAKGRVNFARRSHHMERILGLLQTPKACIKNEFLWKLIKISLKCGFRVVGAPSHSHSKHLSET